MKQLFVLIVFFLFSSEGSAQLPVYQWAKSFVANNQSSFTVNSNGRSVAVDQFGNVYSAGLFTYTMDADPGPAIFNLTAANWANSSIYLSKLSPAGDFIWAIQIPTYVEFGNIEIRVDNDNNICIASELRLATDFDPGSGTLILTPIGAKDAFVAKYNPNGGLIWAKQFGGPGDTTPRSDVLDVDNDNNIVIAGIFNNTVDFDPGPTVYNITSTAHLQSFIVKLSANGDFIWASQFGNSSIVYSGSNIADVKCDQQGNIYLTGDFKGLCDFDPGTATYFLQSQSSLNSYAAKLNSSGNLIWVKSIGNNSLNNDETSTTRGIDVDANQNVYLTGNFWGTFDFDPGPGTYLISSVKFDWYALKLNEQGNFVWANAVGGSEIEIGADVAVDHSGNVYVIGTIGPTADMDPGPGVYPITTVNQYGASAILKVDANGNFIYAATFDQVGMVGGSCLTRRMVMDNVQNIYITGYVAGFVDFDPGPNINLLSSGGTEAPYVLKLARCSNVTTATLNISTCESYTLNNEIFDSTGTYIRTIPNSTGCDSVITLQLTINKKQITIDTAICNGESFLAGGFWQTTAGIYTDTLTTTLGCDSVVTTRLRVNPNPSPALGNDRDLCAGTQAILNPGNYSQYLWQNLSALSTFTVTSPGIYWVKVTNEFNCSATDSLIVTSILASPVNFLNSTDSICNFQQLDLTPKRIFSGYLWSTGATSNQITIDKSGIYWLKVTDPNGCTGTDSVVVYKKDCLNGVYIPSAFTPDNDRLNDEFKAVVFGKLIFFKLQVYNRQGKLIFETTDAQNGWDGTYKGTNYSTSSFIWQCTYQLEGQPAKFRKGAVTIIR